MLREICFEFADGRHVEMEQVTAADFEQFMGHVEQVTRVYRQMIENPPLLEASSRPMAPGEVMRALSSLGSHQVMKHADDRASLDTLVMQRHGRLSVAGPLSPRELTAMVLAIQRRVGTGPELETNVKLAESILERLFPMGVGEVQVTNRSTSGSMSVEDRLVPGGIWGPAKRLEEALRAAGPASAAVVLTPEDLQSGQFTAQVTLYIHLSPGASGESRIVRVDPRTSRPVEVLQSPWTSSDSQQHWTAISARMAVVNAVGKAFHPDAELRDNEAERGLFPDGISRRGLARPEQVPEIALDDIHPDENFYSTSDQELQAPKHSRAIDDVPAIDDWTELGDASTATTAEALPQSQPELNHPQINDTTSVANTALIHTPDSADTGNISLHASSNVFLDAPRTPLTTGMETASNHPSPTRQRRYTEATLQPIMRPLTREALRMAAKQVGDMVGVRQGLENCVDLTDAMLRRLFPGGVRAAAGVWDDSAVGANRAEGRLVPGGTWSRLTSLDQVTQALTENGSTAVVLEQGEQGKGHVNLYVNIGSHSDAPEHAQIVRVDLQATLQDRLAVEELLVIGDISTPVGAKFVLDVERVS
ncbi:hypothetical protein ACFQ51_54875 [Streptomyces kaempferi]